VAMRLGGGQSYNSTLGDIPWDQEVGSITWGPAAGSVILLACLPLVPGCACDTQRCFSHLITEQGQGSSSLRYQALQTGETCCPAGCCCFWGLT
jgi:hypothetical protein